MSNYTQTTFFAPKDSLLTGNPAKLIKGADVDPELAAIATAIATKYDSTNISSVPVGFGAGSVSAPAIYFGSSSHTGLYLSAADTLAITTASSQRVAINASGNVTINAPSSGIGLTVNAVSGSFAFQSVGTGSALNAVFNGGGLVSGNIESSDASRTNMYTFGRDNVTTGNWVLAYNGTELYHVNNAGNHVFDSPSSGDTVTITSTGPANHALTINGAVSSYALNVLAGGSTGTSFGAVINGGTNASDVALNVRNQAGSSLLLVNGRGNVTITPLTNGQALTLNGIANAYTQILNGSSTAGQSFGFQLNAGTNSSDVSLTVKNQASTSTYFNVRGDGALSGLGPVAGALVDMTPDTGTFTATVNSGLTTTPTATCTWTRIGKLVILEFGSGLSGTSNSTGFSATGLPAAIQPATLSQSINLADTVDNGVHGSSGSVLISAGSGTLNFSRNASLAGWTSSGTKSIAVGCVVAYLLN